MRGNSPSPHTHSHDRCLLANTTSLATSSVDSKLTRASQQGKHIVSLKYTKGIFTDSTELTVDLQALTNFISTINNNQTSGQSILDLSSCRNQIKDELSHRNSGSYNSDITPFRTLHAGKLYRGWERGAL